MELKLIGFLVLTFSAAYGSNKFNPQDEYNYNISNVTDQNVTYCFREHDNDKLNISGILGMWKVLEVFMHLTYEGVKAFPVCPVVKIWETEDFPSTTFGVGFLLNNLYFTGYKSRFFINLYLKS